MSCPEPDDLQNALASARCDEFYRGRFALLQPRLKGYRAGLDALLLAAALSATATGRVGDLGSGAGAVGLATACRCPGIEVVCVERHPVMAQLARGSLALHHNAAYRDRIDVAEADLFASRAGRERAGLPDALFDHVLTNPPYHPHDHRPSPDSMRDLAVRAKDGDFLGRWVRAAAALLRPGGGFVILLRVDALPSVLPALEQYVGGVRVLPVHPAPGAAAHRLVIWGRKGSRAPFSILPGISLHDAQGAPTSIARAVSDGTADFPSGA